MARGGCPTHVRKLTSQLHYFVQMKGFARRPGEGISMEQLLEDEEVREAERKVRE